MPIIGYNSIGANGTSVAINKIRGTKGTSAGAGSVDYVKFYSNVTSGTTAWKAVIVDADTKEIVANGIVVGDDVITTTPAWHQATYVNKPAIEASHDYYICIIGDNDIGLFYDLTGNYFVDDSNNYISPTDPTDGTASAGAQYSIYASYTEGAAGPSIPVLMNSYKQQ